MAQRHEVEAWVNPSAWDDKDEAERLIEAILDSGSDSEADWIKVIQGPDIAVVEAAARDHERAQQAADAARDVLSKAVRAAADAGATEAELVRSSGVSRMTVRKWMGKK